MRILLAILVFITPALACSDAMVADFTRLQAINRDLGEIAEHWRLRAEALEARKPQVMRIDPAALAAPRPSRCAGKTPATEQCKKGRTLNKNCKCGVW
jgi:hypothetical protein